MKKISTKLISLFAFLGSSSISLAQSPTITAAAMPSIGYTYNNRTDTTAADRATFTISAGSGSAQTWNYVANFATTYTQTSTFVAPSSGLGNSNFPSANLAQGSGSAWAYFVKNAAGLSLPG